MNFSDKEKKTRISNCDIGEEFKYFNNVLVENSSIGDYVTIGDNTIVTGSQINNNISLNRRNYILRTILGRYSYTGINTMIFSAEIGNFCSISWNVSIGGGDHPHENVTTSTISRFYFLDNGNYNAVAKEHVAETHRNQPKCIIGHDVLISSGVIILRGVTIGNGAIIGAGAVVTKDVEPYSIVAGVPAKKIKMRFEPSIIHDLQNIKWWDWPRETIRQNLDLIYSSKVNAEVIEKLKKIGSSVNA